MPVDITLAVAWDGPKNQYDVDDIIDVFRYTGNVPPPSVAPWVHIHCLNAPFDNIIEAKAVLLAQNAQDDPENPPDDYEPVVINARAVRVEKSLIPQPVKNTLNRDRTYEFDFSVIADSKLYNKKLQRLMALADFGL